MHDCHPRTRLALVGAPSSYFFHKPEVEMKALRRRVAKNQSANKVYTNRRWAAKSAQLQSGQNVWIKRPGHVPKETSGYSQPFTTVKCRQEDTYELDDGRVRNREHLVFFMCTPALASIQSHQRVSKLRSRPYRKQRAKSPRSPEVVNFSRFHRKQPTTGPCNPRLLRATKFIESCCPTTSSSMEAFIVATKETNMARWF